MASLVVCLALGCLARDSQLLLVETTDREELLSLKEIDSSTTEDSIVDLLAEFEADSPTAELTVVFEDPAGNVWKIAITSKSDTVRNRRFYTSQLFHDSDTEFIQLGPPVQGMYSTDCRAFVSEVLRYIRDSNVQWTD